MVVYENKYKKNIQHFKQLSWWFVFIFRVKRGMRKYERIAKRVQPDNKHFKGKQCVYEYYTSKTIFD